MTTNMESPVTLPAPQSLPRRLLDVAPKLDGRWMLGVTWNPRPCRGLLAIPSDDCGVETLDAITRVCETAVVQPPFQIIDALKGTTLDWTLAEVDEMLLANFGLTVSAAFATELITATASSGMGLSTEAHAPNGAAFGSAATPIWNALAILEEELAENRPGQVGYIHLTPGLLAQAVTSYGVSVGASGQWETPVGNIVISDSGYISPAQPTGQAAASTAEDWVYSSGPVAWQASDAEGLGVNHEAYDMTRNTIHRWISGYGILVFDPCPVSAVLASYNLEDATP